MKKALQHTASVLMAVLVLFSTFSFTVDMHYCGSTLVDRAIFSKAESCGMEMDTASKSPSEMKHAPCSEKKVVVKGQKELKHSLHDLDLHQQVFLAAFTYSYFEQFRAAPEKIIPFKDYSPPLLVTDIQLEDQVFLI
ncbi:MAG: hypothetical protein WBV11_13755 [Salegentibacter sp.]